MKPRLVAGRNPPQQQFAITKYAAAGKSSLMHAAGPGEDRPLAVLPIKSWALSEQDTYEELSVSLLPSSVC
jgi:hypothetical protein